MNEKERERYRRQLLMPLWDQDKLASAQVLVAGAGGLGGTSSLYLALAGVGRIRLVDKDRVERSNLNRQILYDEKSLGRLKVEDAGRRLRAANPAVQVETFAEVLDRTTLGRLAEGCSLIVDGLDSIEARWALNEHSVKNRIPYVYGAVQGWQGMVGLFCPPRTACLACLLSSEKKAASEIPVFGCMPGTIALLQATEAIKFLMGVEKTLEGKLLIYDSRDLAFDVVEVAKNPACPVCSSSQAG